MSVYDLGSLGVGSILTTREFTVKPSDLTAHVESCFIGNVIGCGEEVLSTGSLSRGAGAEPWGRVCPLPVALGRVLSALAGCELFRDATVLLRSMTRVRRYGDVLVGEPLTAIAAVRFRSGRDPEAVHFTLAVEVHRGGQGGRAGARALAFEVGLELRPAPCGIGAASGAAAA